MRREFKLFRALKSKENSGDKIYKNNKGNRTSKVLSGFKACLFKDFKLFFSSAGILSLVLPFVLFFLALAGFKDLSAGGLIPSFSIGVIDQDETIMSRSLISQLREIELFSEVNVLKKTGGLTQAELGGNAGVLVIPKDFFYAMYTAEDCPVEIYINENSGIQGTLLRTMFTSVLDIASSEQIATRAAFRLFYKDNFNEMLPQLYEQWSKSIMDNALGRQQLFDSRITMSDMSKTLLRNVLSTVLSMLLMSLAISALKSLPEEASSSFGKPRPSLGILPRFRAIGGSVISFYFSKFFVFFIFTMPFYFFFLYLFPTKLACVSLIMLTLILLSFSICTFFTIITEDAKLSKYIGNLYLFLALLLGGSLWPSSMLPHSLRFFRRFSISYYAGLGIGAMQRDLPLDMLFQFLLPALIACPLLIIAGFAFRSLLNLNYYYNNNASAFTRIKTTKNKWNNSNKKNTVKTLNPVCNLHKVISNLLSLSFYKSRLFAGGLTGLLLLVATALLSAGGLRSILGNQNRDVSIVVLDLDKSKISKELIEMISDREGVNILEAEDSIDLEENLLNGNCEGALTIPKGYGKSLVKGDEEGRESGEESSLSYTAASSSVSVQAIREVIAGEAKKQQSRYEGRDLLASLMGRTLSNTEEKDYFSLIKEEEKIQPKLYKIYSTKGGESKDPFIPGMPALFLMFSVQTALTLGEGSGSKEARRVRERMRSLPKGAFLSQISDILGILLPELLCAAIFFALSDSQNISVELVINSGQMMSQTPWKILWKILWQIIQHIPLTLCFLFFIASFSLLVAEFASREGRFDTLQPQLALLLCLAGGCFIDFSAIGKDTGFLNTLSLYTPVGQFLTAINLNRSLSGLFLLLVEGLICLALVKIKRSREV